MEIGDLVKQKEVGVVLSSVIKGALNFGTIGIIIDVHEKTYFSYDGRSRGDVTVQWSNGNKETIPEIYLEKIEDEQT
ncbi:MAG: hypothetical protein ACW99F_00820 [Candidatus Hodarchaeales archaeon]|jgi:hypothetical protein